MEKRATIIGAGITGLTAAYGLLNKGWRVRVLESSGLLGGLAASVELSGVPVEKYYHFICREDHELVSLISELGLEDRLSWREASTSCFIDGRIYPFNTPFDLLNFSTVPLTQRIRFGINVLMSQLRSDWNDLDGLPAKPWLIRNIGLKAYGAIWDPLLRIKFGKYHDQISAAWIWHRIHRVARSKTSMLAVNSYGFLQRGCHDLISGIYGKISAHPDFELFTNAKVQKIVVERNSAQGVLLASGEFMGSDAVLSTCAIPHFLQLVEKKDSFFDKLASIDYINVVCMLMMVREPFTENFWLNVNDPAISFNGVVETTNLNPRPDLDQSRILYIPYYAGADDPKWRATDDDLYDEYVTALKRIKPDFSEDVISEWKVFRDWNAQAVCRVGFRNIMPGFETTVKNLFITDSSQYYPEDRTLSASVRLGRQVTELIDSKNRY